MFRTAIPALLLLSGPVAAHPGAHLHPHDSGSWLAVGLGLALIASAAGLALLRAPSKARK
ncbi:hypothetical protein ACOXXX_04455 [Thalassococcus sp. BH17M4-6]|uniref:hypothetical protein n=1 Tax=Thalassococcus sp. BH17M4-6 TaxID=3413148 RepID=UPI003BD42C60